MTSIRTYLTSQLNPSKRRKMSPTLTVPITFMELKVKREKKRVRTVKSTTRLRRELVLNHRGCSKASKENTVRTHVICHGSRSIFDQ